MASLITDEGLARVAAAGLRPEQLPRHVAVIMDGNGRWAENRGMPRVFGHREGIKSVRSVVEEGCRIGLEQLTLYCLSVENWKRPPRELTFLLKLFRHFLVVERKLLMEQNVRLAMIGRRGGLPAGVLREFAATEARTAGNTGMTLCLAVNYGGRTEIADAAKRIAEDVRAGALDPERVDEGAVASYLATAGDARPGPPDPDRRRVAGQQLPALADLLRRALGNGRPLARLPGRRPARRLPGLFLPPAASSAGSPPGARGGGGVSLTGSWLRTAPGGLRVESVPRRTPWSVGA